MREIVFRGKRVKDGKWVYGSLFSSMTGQKFIRWEVEDDGAIEEIVQYQVIPETVSQFTGLHDKTGAKIFEGDIVLIGGRAYEIYWNMFTAGFVCRFYARISDLHMDMYEVIGNIHDSPELLK